MPPDRKRALTCDFEDKKDDMIRDQIIDKCKLNDLRRRFLREKDLTLEKLLDIGRSYEAADLRAKKMEHPEQEVNRVKSAGYTTKSHREKRPDKEQREIRNCFRCGRSDHIAKSCIVTKGKKCYGCKREGHFKNMCKIVKKNKRFQQRKTRVRWFENDSESDSNSEQIFVIGNKLTTVNTTICGKTIPLLIDSGASCNVIDSKTWKKLQSSVKSEKCTNNVYTYGSRKPLNVMGKFKANISINNEETHAEFLVVNTKCGSLLGCKTATELKILHIGLSAQTINAVKLENDFQKSTQNCLVV